MNNPINIYFYNYCESLANYNQILNFILLASKTVDILMISKTSLDTNDKKSDEH